MIHLTALNKHHARSVQEYPLICVMLGITGLAIAVGFGSYWPMLWSVTAIINIRLDNFVMGETLKHTDPAALARNELIMMVIGFILVCVFVAMPTVLLMTFRYDLVMVAMALVAAGATRSSTMFAISQRLGLAYFAPYLLVPTSALIYHGAVSPTESISSYFIGVLAILCCLIYIRRSWLVRHSAELALDEARSEALVERDAAARDASLSRLLFQHTSLRAALFDLDGHFIAVNPSWLRAMKKTETEVIGKSFAEAMPNMKVTWLEAIDAALVGKRTKAIGDIRINLDGEQTFLDWEAQPWFNSNGSIGGAVAYAQVVTETYVARAAAAEKQANLELALKASKAFIWEVDYSTRQVICADEALAFFGVVPNLDMLTDLENSPIHPDDREATLRQTARIIKNGGYGRMEARQVCADGSIRWLRTDIAPKTYTDGVPTAFVMLTSDVSEEIARHEKLACMLDRANVALSGKRRLLEELCDQTSSHGQSDKTQIVETVELCATVTAESTFSTLFTGFDQILSEIDDRDIALAAAVQQLRSARSTAEAANLAKSQFLANMSHELRTPLNAIIGYTEILIEDAEYEKRDDAAKDAYKVRNSATHLLKLINEILDLSKIEAGKMDITREPIPLIDVIADIISSSEPLATQNNNKVILDVDCDRTLALTDGFRLRQCLLNLLSNACKFTTNGNITVGLGTTETDDTRRWFDISVTDDGIGMSSEQLERLFRPFSQADSSTTRKYGGTGLGLALTREMTHLLGGEVFVESEEGKGSKFTIRIPALGLEAADVGTIGGKDTTSPMVLIVDDDPNARALTARAATALGMSIATAETGQAALHFCEDNDVALIVLDIQLPDMEGYDVLAALRGAANTRHIPVMVVSVDDDRRKAILAGAQEHLEKPCPTAVLTAAIARLARHKEFPTTDLSHTTTKPTGEPAQAMLTQDIKRSA